MNRIVFQLTLMLIAALALVSTASAGEIPQVGDEFPDISLIYPDGEALDMATGVKAGDSFGLESFNPPCVVVEIYSMYCPFCQKEAPVVNELDAKMREQPELKGKVELIGIGAGNTDFEVNIFRKKYSVKFPLFSDEDYEIHKAVGEVRTPYFFIIKTGAKKNIVEYSRLGAIGDINVFMDVILNICK